MLLHRIIEGYIGMAGTAHALGTLVTCTDPGTSVTDADGKVHGMQGLYIGDGSVLPRSSRVNLAPWGLRLGGHLSKQASAAASRNTPSGAGA
jgi:choline dehydrogenase-like flavoprotein